MARWQSFAISIDKRDYRETSQIVRFLTQDRGLVACLARGAYRQKNSYQGPIDLLVYGHITAVGGDRGGGLDLLTRREVLTNFPELRRELSRYRAAIHTLRLIREGVREGQMIPGLFTLLRAALLALNDRPEAELTAIVFAFEWRLLRMLGVAPELAVCVICGGEGPGREPTSHSPAAGSRPVGRPSTDGTTTGPGPVRRHSTAAGGWTFNTARGGLVCPRCSAVEPMTRRLSPAVLRLLGLLGKTSAAGLAREDGFTVAAGHVRRLLDGYWTYRLERKVDGADWLAGRAGER